MPTPLTSPNQRFIVELHNNAFGYIGTLPYNNMQGEFKLGHDGASIRMTIPYKDYAWITPDVLYPGKSEIWIYDSLVSATVPIYQGQLWDLTANSSDGTLSISTSDYLTYLARRIPTTSTIAISAKDPAQAIADLVNVTMSAETAGGVGFTVTPTTSAVTAYKITATYNRTQLLNYLDIIDDWAALSSSGAVEYYMIDGNQMHVLTTGAVGEVLSPVAPARLEYGGALTSYSFTVQAENLANYYFTTDQDNKLFSSASDAPSIAAYGRAYQMAEAQDHVLTQAQLDALSATRVKAAKTPRLIPQMVLRTNLLVPRRDFYYGSLLDVYINDGWTQYDQQVRVVGWQLTVGRSNRATVVIYANDLNEV